jgi:hypothetical protein
VDQIGITGSNAVLHQQIKFAKEVQYVLASVHQQIENLQIAMVDNPMQAGKL